MRRLIIAICVVLAPIQARAASAAVTHAKLDLSAVNFEVHPDLTYVETVRVDYTLLTERGLRMGERTSMTFYPESQDVEVVEAWVNQPDGERLAVAKSGIFTRPSAASQSAPGFVGSLTTTVLFPQLREGSRTHIVWRKIQKKPAMLGFNVWNEADFDLPSTRDYVDITMPANVPFKWADRGGFVTTDQVADGVRHIHSEIDDHPGHDPEPNMIATSDFQPLFVGTTIPDLATIGTIYHQQERDRVVVTPEIAALAARIVGDKQGLDAAKAVYDWVATNIRYVAVYLDPDDGWVPHAADVVMRNGYGDCKDHAVLMQALLASRGIEAEAAIINWGSRTRDIPVPQPSQFNHVIVYLPAYDVYANPTNPYAPFDAFDRGLAGKTVVIASDPGRVARTPASRPIDNSYRLVNQVRLLRDGTLEGRATLATTANAESTMRGAIATSTSSRDLTERLLRNTLEGGFGELHTSDPRDLAKPLTVEASWTSPHGAPFQGRFAYVHVPTGPDLRSVSFLRGFLGATEDRQTPISVGAADSLWTTTLALPSDTTISAVPADVDVHNVVGSYTATYERTSSGVTVTRHLVVDRDVYEASAYPDLRDLFYTALDDARAVVVLERQTNAEK